MSSMSNLPVRLIDPRGPRFGAAFSVVLLAIAVAFDLPLLAALVGLALGVSAAFGTQYWILGRPWPWIRKTLRLGPPAEPEAELGPRFAQAMGFVVLEVGAVLLAFSVRPLGWLVVLIVVALQTLLAVTGYCLGCRLYGLHWLLPELFDRYVARPGRAVTGRARASQ
jgi:hypothetical protein